MIIRYVENQCQQKHKKTSIQETAYKKTGEYPKKIAAVLNPLSLFHLDPPSKKKEHLVELDKTSM